MEIQGKGSVLAKKAVRAQGTAAKALMAILLPYPA